MNRSVAYRLLERRRNNLHRHASGPERLQPQRRIDRADRHGLFNIPLRPGDRHRLGQRFRDPADGALRTDDVDLSADPP